MVRRRTPYRFQITIEWDKVHNSRISIQHSYGLSALIFIRHVVHSLLFVSKLKRKSLVEKGKFIYDYRNFAN